jgi:hypothetical protein
VDTIVAFGLGAFKMTSPDGYVRRSVGEDDGAATPITKPCAGVAIITRSG